MDNYAAHKHPNVRAWLASNPRIRVHFTPTSSSWLNLVEVWFSIIERQAIHRGSFPSVRDLMIKIRAFIDGWNDRCHPFIWTRPADQVLEKIKRKKNSLTGTRRPAPSVSSQRGCAVIRWRLNSLAGDDEEAALLLPVVIGALMTALQRLVGTDELQRQVGDWLNERRDHLGKPPASLMFVRCTCTH